MRIRNTRKRSTSKRSMDVSVKDHTGELSPVMAYRALVSHSSTHFRADVEFHEQPRQVLFGLILLGIICGLSVVNVTNTYDTALGLRVGILGVLIALVFYCMLQTKDGLMIRPHPILWRAVHGLSLFYLLVIILLIVVPPRVGITIIHELFPDISGGVSVVLSNKAIRFTAHLDPSECAITYANIMRQLKSIWFTAHVLGFWGKMCLLRDWNICMTYSIAFEVVELSLVWLIPEFLECWWDSVFMDVLGANLLGMLLGSLTLKWLSCRKYEWNAHTRNEPLWDNMRRLLTRFTPFSWSQYEWPTDARSSWLSSVCWVGAVLMEFNSFLLIHGLIIRPSHWFNTARLLLLGAQGLQAVPEWYEYVKGNTERIGHNSWIMFTIAAFELLLGFRYGKGGKEYGQTIPPFDVILCWATFLGIWITWFLLSSYEATRGQRRIHTGLDTLRVISYVPLMFLTRRWVF